MSRFLAVFFASAWAQKGRLAPLLPLFVLLPVLLLPGCGPKNVANERAPALEESGEAQDVQPPLVLPDDDGRPLSESECAALLSEGEIDRGLTAEDMRDVVLHFKSLVHGPGRITVEKNLERYQLYRKHIHNVLEEEHLPAELAYLAFVESGYNPLARSRSGALGMWQFIPSTGNAYGMEQNWWLDERKDPYQATRAAAAYLSKLYALFNDWHLAVAAYNAGEGKISRGLAATGAKTFFELRNRNEDISDPRDRLNDENRQYVPRFLAVCKIMRNLDSLGFSGKDAGNVPPITRLEAGPRTDLLGLCRSVGLSWETFAAYNPAYHRYINHSGRTTAVYVPDAVAAQARAYLRRPGKSTPGWRMYTVARGDTMSRIARQAGVPVAELRRINQVSEPLRAGKTVRIPGFAGGPNVYAIAQNRGKSEKPAKAAPARSRTSETAQHRVAAGETLYSIARLHGVDVGVLKRANKLKGETIQPGQRLAVPGGASSAKTASLRKTGKKPLAAAGGAKKGGGRIVRYEVREGDSLWAIARKFNVSPTELLELNHMSRSSRLRPGDTVRVAVK